MSVFTWILVIVAGLFIFLAVIGALMTLAEAKSGKSKQTTAQSKSQPSAEPKKMLIIDETDITDIRQLLKTVDREAKLDSSNKSETWQRCDQSLRAIGEKYFNLGGEDMMRLVFNLVYKDTSLRGHYLNDAWDRVGTWWA